MDNFSLTEHQDEFSLEEAEQGNFSAFGDIIKGDKGDPGAVFTPAVDSDGNISWTNDGGLPNPETQNIKGPQGDPGNYTKPATGIPKTDLAEDVQTSLGKADAALPASGGTMSGAIAMGGNRITGIANGTNDQDAVTKAQLDAAVVGALKPSGSIAFASLPALSASVLNNIYNITDAFTTTSDFVEGSGKSYPAGTNVAVINTGTAADPVYKFDVYTGVIDLSAYRTAADQDVIDAGKLGTGGDGSNVTAAFSAASSRANIATGEKLSVIFGKIAKWFSDLGTAAFRAATNAITQGSTDLIESGAVYTGLAAKQGTISASGILKGDGNGGVSAATAGTDYQAPLIAGTDYETPAGAKALGLTGASAGDLVRVNAVDANGKPTCWTKAPLCEVKTQKNHLINSYFKNAVNQLGQSSYTNVGMTIDRWRLTNGSVSVGPNGLTLNGTIQQTLEFSIGQPVICSALLSDGSLITPTYDDSSKTFVLTAAGQTIVAAKLELGSEQTLAHNEGTEESPVWVLNEIPDYGEELARCKRYFERIAGKSGSTIGLGYGTVSSGYPGMVTIVTKIAPKRSDITAANINIVGTFYIQGPQKYGTSTPTSGINFKSCSADGTLKIIFETQESISNAFPYSVVTATDTAYIDVSAEL